MSMGHAAQQTNPFLTAPVGRLFLSNAVPMAVVMSMGGILAVVDGIFVGHFIGSDALAAVSLAFPVVMVLPALTTLAGGGMSSLMARHLGAGERATAGRVFAGAHGLVLAISVALAVLWGRGRYRAHPFHGGRQRGRRRPGAGLPADHDSGRAGATDAWPACRCLAQRGAGPGWLPCSPFWSTCSISARTGSPSLCLVWEFRAPPSARGRGASAWTGTGSWREETQQEAPAAVRFAQAQLA